MIWNLMRRAYKNRTQIPDKEIAHMMITILMAGQHSSSAVSAWIMLRLATFPNVMENLFQEQVQIFGRSRGFSPLCYEDLGKLRLYQHVVRETLRVHSSIYSLMRKIKNPLLFPGTNWVVPKSHTLLASPWVPSKSKEYFEDPEVWKPERRNTKITSDDCDLVDYGYGTRSSGTKSPYLTIGAGRHRRIGEYFAYLNSGVILATMVRKFRLSNVEGQHGVVGTEYTVCSLPGSLSNPLHPDNHLI
jgi:sterol 14alpha-demethylase